MKLLVINSGSSSVKYQLYEMPSGEVTAKGLVERIGLADGASRTRGRAPSRSRTSPCPTTPWP